MWKSEFGMYFTRSLNDQIIRGAKVEHAGNALVNKTLRYQQADNSFARSGVERY